MLPEGRFSVIYADPPWGYDNKSPSASARPHGFSAGAEYYYDTMSIEAIKSLPVKDASARNAVCFLWAVVPMLPDAIGVLGAWGYKYKTMLTWHKHGTSGMGYWFRGFTEHLLLGVRGDVKAFRSMKPNVVYARVGAHSAKPPEFYSMIEAVTHGPRLELFARSGRPGWTAWGNEMPQVGKNDAR